MLPSVTGTLYGMRLNTLADGQAPRMENTDQGLVWVEGSLNTLADGQAPRIW